MTETEALKIFQAEVANCNSRLRSELQHSWDALVNLLSKQMESFSAAAQIQVTDASLESLDNILEVHARRLLYEPVEEYRRQRIPQRVMNAFDEWDRTVEDLIRSMPEHREISGKEWNQLTGTGGLSRVTLLWRRKPVRYGFRQTLSLEFYRRRTARALAEGRLLQAFGQAGLDLITPWQSLLRSWLAALAGQVEPRVMPKVEIGLMSRRLERHKRNVTRALAELGMWLATGLLKTAKLKLPTRAGNRDGLMERFRHESFRHREFCIRQGRAVESEIELSLKLVEVERAIVENARGMLSSIETEHRALLDELGRVVSWLSHGAESRSSTFPPAETAIVSVASRLSHWSQSFESALQSVPDSIEVKARLAARPNWRHSWRQQAPRSIFRNSLERTVRTIEQGLDHAERQHQGIVREIERAREVVAFAKETSGAAHEVEAQIEQEGLANARVLLESRGEKAREVPPEVERSLLAGTATTFFRVHTVLEEGQLGLMRHAARYGLPAAGRLFLNGIVERAREATKTALRSAVELHREGLIRIGWLPAPTARMPHVLRRGHLTVTIGAESHRDRLPMIYQRLFRLTPVEDPRFLVGRQQELEALEQARLLWEEQREAGVVIVGERGSGKTSLINCALQGTLRGMEFVRGEFSSRLTERGTLYDFLGGLLGVEADQVENDLQSKRRLIILEEMERTFLRRVNQYDALRSLLNLVSKTSRQNLWILSTNYFSFRLLNASLRIDPHFSHRINAMSVERAHLADAILMRHNLSGLKLRFAPLPGGASYPDRLRKIAGVETDPQTAFFDRIYLESGGVFRTAFALWQRYVDRAEGGILYMRRPPESDHERILASLNDLDLYTLAAILQHGSLTPGEHSLVFQINEATSHAWLDNLLARELIEPDPGREGLRIVPEAGEIVRRTLFRRNIA